MKRAAGAAGDGAADDHAADDHAADDHAADDHAPDDHAADDHVADDGAAGVAGEIWLAVVVALAQGAGLAVAGLVLIAQTVFGHADDLARALSDAAFALGGGAIVAALAINVNRLVVAARTPLVVIQILALPVGYSLAFPSGRPAWGAPVLLTAAAVLYLLATPAAREQLRR